MLKPTLIREIFKLNPTNLFSNTKLLAPEFELKQNKNLRDYILSTKYQFRSGFEILNYEDVPETVKTGTWFKLISVAARHCPETNKQIRKHVHELDSLINFGVSELNKKLKSELEKILNLYSETFKKILTDLDKVAETKKSELKDVVLNLPQFVIYVDQENIFEGKIKEFLDPDFGFMMDYVSNKTSKECQEIISQKNRKEESIAKFYENARTFN